MICNTCGRNIQNENANFCEYCGSSFREIRNASVAIDQQDHIDGQVQRQSFASTIPMQNMMSENIPSSVRQGETEKPISFLSWLGSYGILVGLFFIPFGWIAALILLCFWSFSDKTPKTKKNWARVNLIVIGVVIIVFFLLMLTMINSPMFQDMINGSFDMNSYYQSMYNNLK